MAWRDISTFVNPENLVAKKQIILRAQQIIRIDLDIQDILLIGLGATLAKNSVILKIGGYGAGAERIAVNKELGNTNFELYINGTSERGCVYIKSTFSSGDYQLIYTSVVSLLRETVDLRFVDAIPSDATKYNF